MVQKSSLMHLSPSPDAFIYLAAPSVQAFALIPFTYKKTSEPTLLVTETLTAIRVELKEMRQQGVERDMLLAFVVFNQTIPLPPPLLKALRDELSGLFASLAIPALSKSAGFDPKGLSVKLAPDSKSLMIKSGTNPLGQRRDHPQKVLRVLIVDDSKVIHKLLGDMIGRDPRFEVCGYAFDPIEAEGKIDELKPDVLTLDFQMPRMDGLTYLKQMIPRRQLPVVMISGASSEDGRLALQALEYGAFDFIQKPSPDSLDEFEQVLCEKVFAATQLKRSKIKSRSFEKRKLDSTDGFEHDRIVLIGSSTGGTVALSEIITALPADFPPIVIVQHIPERFSLLFAERLDKISAVKVKEAAQGDVLQTGHVFIAPGGRQLKLVRSSGRFQIEINDEPPVNRHRPSVDYMFFSAAEIMGPDVTAVILTGMGKDGAQGMLKLKEKGASTIAQDADSCVVYGMPKAAAELGAAQAIVSLDRIADTLINTLKKKHAPPRGRSAS